MKIRLDKWLGALNLGSRKQVQELVKGAAEDAPIQCVRNRDRRRSFQGLDRRQRMETTPPALARLAGTFIESARKAGTSINKSLMEPSAE